MIPHDKRDEARAWNPLDAKYTDGTGVKEGDLIRSKQQPGGLLPPGPWMEGVAVTIPNDRDNGKLYMLSGGRRYNIVGHIIEAITPNLSNGDTK